MCRIGLLLAAQFLSGLADNALLVVTMARLAELRCEAWLAPLLKLFFAS
jgi:LPLT family lysophospholipid transporter-like MFS transporter